MASHQVVRRLRTKRALPSSRITGERKRPLRIEALGSIADEHPMKENAVVFSSQALARPQLGHRAGTNLALDPHPIPARMTRRSYIECKTVIDYLLAVILIGLFLPVLFLCALLVKLSSKGPVFYRQLRVGQHGRLFEIIKLRTMRMHAERETGPVWARDNDPR